MNYAIASLFALLISVTSLLPSKALAQAGSQKGKDFLLFDFPGYDSLTVTDKATLDSLLPLYHKAQNDTTRYSVLNSLVESLNEVKLWTRYNQLVNEKTSAALKNQEKFSKKEIRAIKKYYASSLQTFGYYQENSMSNLQKALEYYNECRKIQEEIGDLKGLGFTINNMAIVFQHQGNITKSLEYYMESLKIAESINEKQPIAYALNNVGTLYLIQGDTATALRYQMRALKIRQEIGDKQGVIYSLGNIGSLYKAKGDYKKALDYYFECFKIAEENGQRQGMGYANQHIATIYQSLWETAYKNKKALPDSLFQRSLHFYKNSLALVEELGDKRGITVVEFGVGKLYFILNDMKKATENTKRSLALAQEIGYPTLIRNASELLYKIYKKEGKIAEALTMHELFIQMRDSVTNEDTRKSTFRQKTKYEFEKQKALNDLENQKVLALAEEEKKRQQVISNSIGIGLIMMLLFAIFIFNRLQITRKQKLVIEEQKGIVDEKNKHITYSINYAKRIQDAILPSTEELNKYFTDHFVYFQPREIVSGDFYWVSRQNNKTILAVADCTGHGVPGAFMSMIGNTLLNEIVNAKKILQPAEILNHLNEGIVQALHQESRSQDDGMDISVCLFDRDAQKLTFAGANHSLYIGNGKSLQKIDGDFLSIGSMFGKQQTSFSQKEISLEQNSIVFLSTDGFPDQPGGEKGNKFMTKRFQELLRTLTEYPLQEQKTILKNTFEEWKKTKQQIDDVLVMGIKI